VAILETTLAAGLLAGWAFAVEPFRLAIRRYGVPWPAPAEGRLRIGVLSDLHAAWPHVTPGRITRIVRRLLAQRPEVVLLAGDFATTDTLGVVPVPPARMAAALAPLAARVPCFAVLGNHDHDHGAGEVAEALEAAGIRVLVNEHVRIPAPFGELVLVGVDDPVTGRDDVARALAGVAPDEPVLLLAHAPDLHLRLPPQVVLLVAGHTHGGQVRLPGLPPPVTMSRLPRRQAHGFHHDRGRRLVVSAGIGTTGLPLRFARPPELVVLDLTATGRRGRPRPDAWALAADPAT